MTAILFSLPGRAGPLLRRRDRHGRQHLPRRPRRRSHADAVDGRPERRLLARRLRAALPAAADGSGLRLPGGQRRGAAAHADVAAALAAPLHRAAQERIRCSRSAATRRCGRRTRASSPTSAATSDEIALCVHNLSRSAQAVELDLSRFEGLVPEEMLGRTRFPRIGELPYLLTLAGRGFFWFQLVERRMTAARAVRRAARRGASSRSCASSAGSAPSRARSSALRLVDTRRAAPASGRARRRALEIRYGSGTHDLYQLLVGGRRRATGPAIASATADELRGGQRPAVRARAGRPDRAAARCSRRPEGTIEFCGADGRRRDGACGRATCGSLGVEQSNTSVVIDDELIVKVYRRIEPGVNPELELLHFFATHGFDRTCPSCGAGGRTRAR